MFLGPKAEYVPVGLGLQGDASVGSGGIRPPEAEAFLSVDTHTSRCHGLHLSVLNKETTYLLTNFDVLENEYTKHRS